MPGGTSTHECENRVITISPATNAAIARPAISVLARITSRPTTPKSSANSIAPRILLTSLRNRQRARRQVHRFQPRRDLLHEFILNDLRILPQRGASPRDGRRFALRFRDDRL